MALLGFCQFTKTFIQVLTFFGFNQVSAFPNWLWSPARNFPQPHIRALETQCEREEVYFRTLPSRWQPRRAGVLVVRGHFYNATAGPFVPFLTGWVIRSQLMLQLILSSPSAQAGFLFNKDLAQTHLDDLHCAYLKVQQVNDLVTAARRTWLLENFCSKLLVWVGVGSWTNSVSCGQLT